MASQEVCAELCVVAGAGCAGAVRCYRPASTYALEAAVCGHIAVHLGCVVQGQVVVHHCILHICDGSSSGAGETFGGLEACIEYGLQFAIDDAPVGPHGWSTLSVIMGAEREPAPACYSGSQGLTVTGCYTRPRPC